MVNQMQVFENREFGKIEVFMINGKPYFPASDCAKMLGYSNPQKAIRDHCPHRTNRSVGVQTGVKADGTAATQTIEKIFIPEGDLYRLIIGSKLQAAVRFEEWVCDTVLPTIRKYGAYITDDTLRRMREDSTFAKELMGRLGDEQAKNTALMEYVDELKPKAQYCDIILQNSGPVQASIIAKDYGMTAIKFNKLLHKMGIQFKVGGTWLLYKDLCGKGYTVTKTYMINGMVASIQTCWTQKGRMWLYNVLKWDGILPEAEKEAAVAN